MTHKKTSAGWASFFLAGLCLSAMFFAPGAGLASAAKQGPIVVGVVMPMTGQVAAYGQMCWAGIKIAHEMRPKVMGRKVRLVLVDNKSDNVEAANAASRLVKKEKAIAILGPATSSKALAVGPIAEKAGIPMIATTATNPLVTQQKKYVFRVCFIDSFQGAMAARFAYETLKSRKAAVLIDVAQDYCVGLANFFMRAYKKIGGEILVQTKCNTGDQDFSAQIGTIKASGADLLYIPNYYTENALMARQAREQGLEIPILSGDGAHAPELIKIGGSGVEGLHFSALFNPVSASGELAKDFFARYEKARQEGVFKDEVTAFHVLGGDAYLVLLDAIKRAGGTSGAKLRAAIIKTKNFQAVSGATTIGTDGNAVKSVPILKVLGGKFTHVVTMKP